MEFEEGDIVLCTVDKIEGTVVFVNIEGGGEGSIITSEIAPGRIRNLRDYVVPKKKIVCKVLRADSNKNIHLSLRRVTQKERKEVLEFYQQEKKAESILKSNIKNPEEIIEEIKKGMPVTKFLEEAKTDSSKLERLLDKKDAEKVLEIIRKEKPKKAVIKKEFFLKTTQPDGINSIKKMLKKPDVEIKYISAGKYLVRAEDENIKLADNKVQEILKDIEKDAKKNKAEFSVKEK